MFDHPGHIELDWMFWESIYRRFCPDPQTRAVIAPTSVHMIGRPAEAENPRINGSYVLAGIMEGRPAYVQPGTRNLLRYSSRTDRWLLDPDGLMEPSLLSRLYNWIFRGDPNVRPPGNTNGEQRRGFALVSEAAGDRCAAFSEASGSAHPGMSTLEWFVWDSRRYSFKPDPQVRCTTAPLTIQAIGQFAFVQRDPFSSFGLEVAGRGANRENAFINGDYFLAGVDLGRAFYQKPGTPIIIRFWPQRSCWLIGRGLQPTDACSAFADCLPESEFPGDVCSAWYVYESIRGCHFSDSAIVVFPTSGADPDNLTLSASMCSSRLDEAADKNSSTLRSSIPHRYGLYGA
eukprot:symbB.v1.2.009402.t1/scaffold531.1/size191016/14